MDFRAIIADAWAYTQSRKKLIYWFGFLPSIFTTIAGILYVGYQFFAFKKSALFDNAGKSFLHDVVEFVFTFLTRAERPVLIIVIVAILGLIYLLLPTLTQAAAIQTIARERNGQHVSIGKAVSYGLLVYLPLFEYHTVMKTFGFFSILLEAAFVLRNLGLGVFQALLPLFIVFFAVGFILALLFTYADLFIIVDHEGVGASLAKSAKIVVLHWQQTFLITLLMLIIGARIILQILLLLLIPGIFLAVGAYLATITLAHIGLIIGIVLGTVALFFAAYLAGIVEIFSYAVWTYTFLALTGEKEVSARDAGGSVGGE